MRVVIVNCFDTYENRIDMLHDFFINKGDKVSVLQSDFRHFHKVKRIDHKADFTFIPSKPYYKNMSAARLISHYRFAKKAFQCVEDLKPDLLYVIVPPNSLAKFAAQYKIKHSHVKLIFDLIDLWPETMPIGKIKAFPPFSFWRLMRDNSLEMADFVITECNLYQSILKDALKGIKCETIYLAKREIEVESHPVINKHQVHLAYLGSINNIIDIPKIKRLIKAIHQIKPTTLHIIGDGESRDILIDEVKQTGAKVEDHGKIYDPQKKQDIFDKCYFGLNVMKDDVCVGLTMKSIDYFQHQLPILNNIQGDTSKIIERQKIGINITDKNSEEVASKVAGASEEALIDMKQKTKKVFDSMFSDKMFYEKLDAVIKEL